MQNMTIKSNLCEVSRLAGWLQELLTAQIITTQTMKQDVISQLELLLVEAVNNVIEHGYAGEADHPINVDVAVHTDRVVLTITDQGKQPPSADAYINADLPAPECLPESGWGIGLISTIADRIEIDRTGSVNTTIVTKYIAQSDDMLHQKTSVEA